MKTHLLKLSSFLSKEALVPEARAVENLWRGSKNISDDWDIEEEENQLSLDSPDLDRKTMEPSTPSVDKLIRETSPYPGWNLPGEERSAPSMDLDWIMEDVLSLNLGRGKHISSDEITPEFILAVQTAGDGSRPKFVGSGVFGAVWDIGNNRLIKIYDLAAEDDKKDLTRGMIFNDLLGAEYELMVHSSGKFLQPELISERPKGWKVMEKLINNNDMKKIHPGLHAGLSSFILSISSEITDLIWNDDDNSIAIAMLRKRTLGLPAKERNKILAEILREPETTSVVNKAAEKIKNNIENIKYKRWSSGFEDQMAEEFSLDPEWVIRLIKHMLILHISRRIDVQLKNIGIRPSVPADPEAEDWKPTGTLVFFDA